MTLDIFLRCVPPSVTAQQKRVRVVAGRPVFFHGAKMRAAAADWAALLRPYQPATPMDGPLALAIRLTYPHLKRTSQARQREVTPKVSKPDAGNAAKHLEDVLTRLRFIVDDALIARLLVEKMHGPPDLVGIRIHLSAFQEASA
jgi:Holliday junction resolvase RusA-like endonuclease